MKSAALDPRATSGARRMQASPVVNKAMGITEWLLLGLLSVIWGGSFFFIEVAVADVTPFTLVLCRVGLASAVLLLICRLTGRRLPTERSLWGAFLVMGLLNNIVPFSLIAWSQQHIQSSLASILNATTPIFSVVLAHFLTREERLTLNRGTGVLLGWLGVALLIGVASLEGVDLQIAGYAAVLGAALCYACAAIFGRRFRGLPPVTVTTGMLCCSTVSLIPLALIFEQPFALHPGPAAWGAILGLSLVSTVAAYMIYFKILATAGATNILLVTFLIPISAILLGVLILGERLEWNAVGGMLLIFAGLIAIDGRLLTIWRKADQTIKPD
jgi:drug/metabolite transporter (DMT)-like permease